MNQPLLACLLSLSLVTLQACSSSGDTAAGPGDNPATGKTKGQTFSECLDSNSPDECDRIINRRSNGY